MVVRLTAWLGLEAPEAGAIVPTEGLAAKARGVKRQKNITKPDKIIFLDFGLVVLFWNIIIYLFFGLEPNVSFAICLSITHMQDGFNAAGKNIWKRLRFEGEFNDFSERVGNVRK